MMGWAVVGSRRAGAPLYFNRPKGSGGTNPQFAEQSQLGDAGDDMWKNKSVAAVNHFRNAMDGKGENLQNCGDKSCLMIERSTSDGIQNDGVVIANMGGDKSLSGMETTLDDGTYPDEVNGGQLVVSNHEIVSGTAKGGAVSVFYVKGESDPNVSVEAASKEFSSDNVKVTLRAQDADNLKYTTTEGESGSFTDGKVISVGKTLSIGETATVKVTGTAAKDGKKVKRGQALSASVTVKKVEVPKQNLAAQYSTNKVGMGVKKTINFNAGKDASIADWDSSMLIAQGAANDDPRVYRPNSMYEVPIDLYALYGAYDDDNLYLMWEMTNVQDVVDTGDDYPLSQGHLWQTQNLPFHIAIDTRDDSTRIGNNGGLQTGGSLWASNITWGGEQKLNNVVTISTNGSNGPWIYKGDETGLNSKAAYGPAANAATNTKKSNIKFGYGNGILSKDVIGIDGGWGENNGRFIGDMKAENQNKAKWVNFNEKGHNSAQMDDHYEIAIPLEEIGTTADRIASSGIGIELAATFGLSAMDSLPYDLAMNDNADLPDTGSQVNNSFEKSDDDMFSVKMANIGGEEPPVETKSVRIDQSDYSVDLSEGVATKQLTATTDPKGASVSWSSSDKDVATVSPKGVVTPRKAGKATITAKSGTKTSSITVTVTGQLPPDPVAKNTIYAAKPSGWGKIYAYVYTGDGATAANNAAWPGVEMTAPSATDGCQQTDLYKYVVPDNLAKGAKVIFNDGGSQQYPGSRQPGLDYNGGIVKWDGSSGALAAVECETTIPVTSVSVSGDGVSGGKLSLKSGASVQLTATVKPDNATDRKVTWTSSDSSVANVMGTGVVTAGSKAGKATVTATAGGKSASVEVTVEAQDPYAELDALAKAHASDLEDGTYTVSTVLKDGMVLDVADGSAKDGANARLWSSNGTKAQRWTVSHDSKGYVTLRNVNSGKALDVKDGKAANGSNVQQYAPNSYRSQKWVAVRSGSVYKLVSALSPSMALDVKDGKAANGSNVQIYTANGYRSQQWTFKTVAQPLKSATVWYRPSSTQSRVRVQWRVYGSPDTTGGVEMTQACGGWWKATVPSAGSTRVGLSFSYGSTTDDNGGKLYDVKGESAAVSGGQAVTDVTPNCAVTNK